MVRLETVAEAARQNVSLVYTFCYAKDFDDAHVRKIAEAVESNGGAVCFVLLTAEMEILEKRIFEKSRMQFRKLNHSALKVQRFEIGTRIKFALLFFSDKEKKA